MRVSMSLRSCRMGRSVPRAVVVSAMATAMPSTENTENDGQATTTRNAMAKVTAQVAAPRLPSAPVRLLGLIS